MVSDESPTGVGWPAVRRASGEDAEAIAQALLDAPQFERTLTEQHRSELIDRARATIDRQDELRTLLVVELDGVVVGYAHVHWVAVVYLPGPEGYVTELFVVRAARGRRCGGALLRAVEELAVERGASRLFLVNGYDTEAYAREFYPKHGFRETTHLTMFRREFRER